MLKPYSENEFTLLDMFVALCMLVIFYWYYLAVKTLYNPERWITWLVDRWRTPLDARLHVNCRTHEHRLFERILRLWLVQSHTWLRVYNYKVIRWALGHICCYITHFIYTDLSNIWWSRVCMCLSFSWNTMALSIARHDEKVASGMRHRGTEHSLRGIRLVG